MPRSLRSEGLDIPDALQLGPCDHSVRDLSHATDVERVRRVVRVGVHLGAVAKDHPVGALGGYADIQGVDEAIAVAIAALALVPAVVVVRVEEEAILADERTEASRRRAARAAPCLAARL